MYTDTDDGLPGNDDAGQMSAWFVCTMLYDYYCMLYDYYAL